MKIAIIILLTMTVISSIAYADYDISWYTIDSGGGTSLAGAYSLTGTIGQHDAGIVSSDGNDYSVNGGFWPGVCSCVVDMVDLSNFVGYWLETGEDIPADIDGDGFVDLVDYSYLAYYWLENCPSGWKLKY